MGKKVFKLTELCDVEGRPFQEPETDESGSFVREPLKDAEGNPVMQIPRDAQGKAMPNCNPEPAYKVKAKPMGERALPEMLKKFYLHIPADMLTRQDTIYGTRLFQNIADSKNGTLEIDEDILKWVNEKLQNDKIGVKIFGVNLHVVEQALDNFERPHKKEAGKNDA